MSVHCLSSNFLAIKIIPYQERSQNIIYSNFYICELPSTEKKTKAFASNNETSRYEKIHGRVSELAKFDSLLNPNSIKNLSTKWSAVPHLRVSY